MKEAVESFSCVLHTSLLDLAERKLGLFFCFAGKYLVARQSINRLRRLVKKAASAADGANAIARE